MRDDFGQSETRARFTVEVLPRPIRSNRAEWSLESDQRLLDLPNYDFLLILPKQKEQS